MVPCNLLLLIYSFDLVIVWQLFSKLKLTFFFLQDSHSGWIFHVILKRTHIIVLLFLGQLDAVGGWSSQVLVHTKPITKAIGQQAGVIHCSIICQANFHTIVSNLCAWPAPLSYHLLYGISYPTNTPVICTRAPYT